MSNTGSPCISVKWAHLSLFFIKLFDNDISKITDGSFTLSSFHVKVRWKGPTEPHDIHPVVTTPLCINSMLISEVIPVTIHRKYVYFQTQGQNYFLHHDPDSKACGANMGYLGPVGPRWAPCGPRELCYLGSFLPRFCITNWFLLIMLTHLPLVLHKVCELGQHWFR